MDTATDCSFCNRPATRVGDGRDGEFYCPKHLNRAPGTTSRIDHERSTR